MMRLPLHAPSVEMQTIEFIEQMRTKDESGVALLQRYGFRVEVEFHTQLPCANGGMLSNVICIVDAYVPPRYRQRGWFTHYLKMCSLLTGDALIIYGLYGPVRDALVRKGFEQTTPTLLSLEKKPVPPAQAQQG